MFGFNKPISVKEYLDRYNRLISSGSFISKEVESILKKIESAINDYLRKYEDMMEPVKHNLLKEVIRNISDIRARYATATRQEHQEAYNHIASLFDKYASLGPVYLLRHATRSQTEGREMSEMGVKESKKFAELIRDEILLVPKEVQVIIRTSELKRTDLFARVISYINKSDAGKHVKFSIDQDKRLFLEAYSDRAEKAYIQTLSKYTDKFDAFMDWVEKKSPWDELIRDKEDPGPELVLRNMTGFVQEAQGWASRNDSIYPIVIGISHGWRLDILCYTLTKERKVLSTSEFAKFENNRFYYKGKWY